MMRRRRWHGRGERWPSGAAIGASRLSSRAARLSWPLGGPLGPSACLGAVVAFAWGAAAATDARSLDLAVGMVLRPSAFSARLVDFARPLRAFGFRATVAATDPRS